MTLISSRQISTVRILLWFPCCFAFCLVAAVMLLLVAVLLWYSCFLVLLSLLWLVVRILLREWCEMGRQFLKVKQVCFSSKQGASFLTRTGMYGVQICTRGVRMMCMRGIRICMRMTLMILPLE